MPRATIVSKRQTSLGGEIEMGSDRSDARMIASVLGRDATSSRSVRAGACCDHVTRDPLSPSRNRSPLRGTRGARSRPGETERTPTFPAVA